MRIVGFDFEMKTEATLEWSAVGSAAAASLFYWIDMAAEDEAAVAPVLAHFHVNASAAAEFLGPDRDGRYDAYDDCLHFSLTEAGIEGGRLAASHVDVLMGASYMITWHRKPLGFLDQVHRVYRDDFKRFAKTPGFLVYELCDNLIENYRRMYARFSEEVERVQLNLFGAVDDRIFRHVSDLTTDLLGFRKTVLAARELFHQLSSRRSAFLSETTQAYLGTMASTLERISGDVSSEREVLNESLNLYMGMVSHRTNRVINRLTVLSMIFLPLTFICGVYGMNFEMMPELGWFWSYPAFWAVCLAFVTVSVCTMRRRKWL